MDMDPSRPVAPVTSPTPSPAPTAPVATLAPVVAVAARRKSGGVLNLLLIGAALLAIGGVAFAIGRSTAPASAFQPVGALPDGGTAVRPDGSFAPGAGGPGAGGPALGGGLSLAGTVKAVDGDSLTLTLENGEEMTFTLDDDTTYREATDAAASDVAVGDDVSVRVAGRGRIPAAEGGQAPELTAEDVTVSR
jgi:hypothetical protein